MTLSVSYEELYQEIERVTSSPLEDLDVLALAKEKTLSSESTLDITTISAYREADEIGDNYILALTPPSPIRNTSESDQSRQEIISIFEGIFNLQEGNHQAFFPEPPRRPPSLQLVRSMCDNSEMSTPPSVVVSTSGPSHSHQGKHMQVEGTPSSNQSFQSQAQQHSGTLSQLLGHNNNNHVEMETHHSNSQQQHFQQSQQHHYQNHIQQQHNSMEGHQHQNISQQLNMSPAQQHSISGPPQSSHFSHGPPPQLMPFGMHMNAGNYGNGGPYPFHHHPPPPHHPHQMPAQHMNPLQHAQACFMQHAACMHLQHQHQSFAALSNSQRAAAAAAAVGWMTGQGSSNVPTSNNGPGCGNNNKISSCGPSVPISLTKPHTPILPDPNALPGGLEVLWRELPTECQKLMVPQDIPDTARFRGYFTVCELLTLKRALEARFLGCAKTPAGTPISPVPVTVKSPSSGGSGGKEDVKRGTKRGREIKEQPRNASKRGRGSQKNSSGKHRQENMDGRKKNMEQNGEDDHQNQNVAGELMVNIDSLKQEQIQTTAPPAVTGLGVGGIVKEAMEALSSAVDHNGVEGNDEVKVELAEENDKKNGQNGESSQIAPQNPNTNEMDQCNTTGEVRSLENVATEVEIETELEQKNEHPGTTDISEKTEPNEGSSTATIQCVSTLTVLEDKQEEFPPQLGPNSNSMPSHMGVHVVQNNQSIGEMHGGNCCTPIETHCYTAPPPPYRTATLVLKLLKIGQYHIRSFSCVNPNRLRVLFNSQRLTYECQLPVFRPPPTAESPSPHPLRKVLTVDIGFDQISMIRFGPDSLCMKVEGPPLLTISFNPAQEEVNPPSLTPENHFLLEQIEKGQLKLSPIHELYFLNERLVQLLDSQFREHPKFRHLLIL